MTNSDEALGLVGSAMTLMFGVAMIKYAQDSTKDLMKKGRGKAKIIPAPDFSPPSGKLPKFDPYANWG
jgi:hypothetical protein|tara:strand:- start:28 stop:231 length:204 start_codon:yes stop_codon:yes gene_type:complete